MSDNSRGSRDSRNDEHSGPVRKDNQQSRHPFANGFEGMNFEEIRKPYRGGRGNNSPEGENGERRGDDRLQ